MERTRIPESESLVAGSWLLIDGQPVFRCPCCRRASPMRNHSVDPDGTVNASIGCVAPCSYHVWGILEEWTHGSKPAGERVK
jgi:hypothetical protein